MPAPTAQNLRVRPLLVELEARTLFSVASLARILAAPDVSLQPAVTNTIPAGYRPDQVRHAYAIDRINFNGVPGDGGGQTIAIVDAYNNPHIAMDLAQFSTQYHLPQFNTDQNDSPKFIKVNQIGRTTFPRADADWALEIALDVEWAHAIAPAANILLVEADSASLADLLSAVTYARKAPGVTAVSMSWGTGEFRGETNYDSDFTTPANHPGVTFVAASGDSGSYGTFGDWPAVSPNVVSAGGTTLTLNGSNNISTESAWSGSGGGFGLLENEPAYQSKVQESGYRTAPDVAFNADPQTGYAVYDTVPISRQTGWFTVGGTSAAAPAWAGLLAIVAQGRAALSSPAPSLDGATDTLPALYTLPAADFHDITNGDNGYPTAIGYDLSTGLGTPVADKLVEDLVKVVARVRTIARPTTPGTFVPRTGFALAAAGSGTAGLSFDRSPVVFRAPAGTSSLAPERGESFVIASGPEKGLSFSYFSISPSPATLAPGPATGSVAPVSNGDREDNAALATDIPVPGLPPAPPHATPAVSDQVVACRVLSAPASISGDEAVRDVSAAGWPLSARNRYGDDEPAMEPLAGLVVVAVMLAGFGDVGFVSEPGEVLGH
jgi:hypothetical protein